MPPPVRLALAGAFALAALAGCGGTRLSNNPAELPDVPESVAAARERPGETMGFIARLQPLGGTAATGAVVVTQRGDVAVLNLNLTNVGPGPYAWVLHERGNCSSRNGLSAGKPWTLPGSRKFPLDLLPVFGTNSDGTAVVTVRVPGGRADGDGGINNRAVLVYAGADVKPIQADVPNNVVACGVFEPARSVLF